ncbi:hypothetical protein WA026_005836 [Henosepilachna vigintioctopunctata]|uniref:Uncharacterized protein n=1 Tax=Henosepilachna vigintioctopunctata TaxID=420089 RepID=A0AAW1U2Z4_9CUCU
MVFGMTDENKNKNHDDDEEDIIDKAIGKFGKWQFQLSFILALVNIPCTWHIFVPTFHGREMEVWCARPPKFYNVSTEIWIDKTQPNDFCTTNDTSNASLDPLNNLVNVSRNMVDCKQWEFAHDGSTLISEFDLLCDRKSLLNMAEMFFLAGVAVGGLICGIISDKCGRKRTLLSCCAIAFVPYFELYCALRLMLGFISVSVVFSGFVLSIELVGGHWRTVTGICYLFPVSIGYCIISAMAWFLRDWRHLQLAISAPGLLFLTSYFFLPESPRWLWQQEKLINVYLVYYGLVLNLENIGGDIYINSVLTGLVEVPALAVSIPILIKKGRRWPLALSMIISGIACAFIVPFKMFSSTHQWVITTFSMISKMCISSSNAIMPVFTAELYPTTLRNIGVGASNVAAGIALMLVPYLFELKTIEKTLPVGVLAFCGIIGGLSVLFLPETGGKPLQETLNEKVAESRRASRASQAVFS